MDSYLNESLNSTYSPFQLPPNLDLAKEHSLAKRVSKPKLVSSKVCPCCKMPSDNELLSLCSPIQNLAFLGCGNIFYFSFVKFVIIIFALFIVPSFIKIYLMNCNENNKCYRIYNIPILYTENSQNSWFSRIFSSIIFWIIFFMKPFIFNSMKRLNDETTNASFYSIMVRNLPNNLTKIEVKDFFTNLLKHQVVNVKKN